MKSCFFSLQEWIQLYQKAYLIAEDEQISSILAQIFTELQANLEALMAMVGEERVLTYFSELLSCLEQKDYVRINDILTTKITPILMKENELGE